MKKIYVLLCFMFLCVGITWSQGFKVSGNKLLDANGNNFVMKGVNVPLAWFVTDVNNNITNIKNKTGANCFRIVVTTSTPDNAWQTCVQNCINNKVIPIVELHDVTGNNSPSELNRMATWWTTKKTFLTRPDISKYILINIANEWSDWFMSATATGTVSRVTWRDAYITAVKTMRNAGINTTLVLDAAGYGQDNKAQTILTYAPAVQAADPQHNCLFSIHMYCEWAVGGNSSVTSLLPAVKNAGIPVIVGEFGFQHAEGNSICDIDESQIINTANSNGIGWLAWSWKGNGSPVQFLDLSADWAGNSLSAWGNTVVNGTGGTKTAVTASVFSTTTTNTPPTVSISAPATNATFTAPASVTITANAADANGTVSNVQFFNGTTLLDSDATAPYSFTWANVAAGTYSITAKATDNVGAVTTSTAVSVKVNAATTNTPPTVSITAPATNATFTAPASVIITANAADANGTVSNVQFFNGTTLLGSDATAPYSFTWTNVAAGTYSITAKATDNAGAVTTSSAVAITVGSVTNTPPTVSISSPLNNASFTAPASVAITANAADVNGTVSNVQFFNGTTLLSSDATAPYSFTWMNVVAGTYSLTAKATDNAGSVTTSSVITVTVSPATTGTGDITGPTCGTKNTSATFALSAGAKTNATTISWWFTGSSQSVTPVSGDPSKAVINYGSSFTGGEVCAGVNYSTAPWFKQYCITLNPCGAGARMEDLSASELILTVAPNPTISSFTFTVPESVESFTVVNDLGATVYAGGAMESGASITLGDQFSSGLYTLFIQYASGRGEYKRIQKSDKSLKEMD